MDQFFPQQAVGGIPALSPLASQYLHGPTSASAPNPLSSAEQAVQRKTATARPKCGGCEKNLKVKCDFMLCKTCCNRASNECRVHNKNTPGYTGGKSVGAYERHLVKEAAEQQRIQALVAQGSTQTTPGLPQADISSLSSPALSAQVLQQKVQKAALPHLQNAAKPLPHGRPSAGASTSGAAAAPTSAPPSVPPQAAVPKAALPAPVENVDLRQVLSAHQQEAEEVRLWRQALYSREKQRRQEAAAEAMERYCRNCSLLQELFTPHPDGPAALFQDQRDAIHRLHEALLAFSAGRGSEQTPDAGVGVQLNSSSCAQHAVEQSEAVEAGRGAAGVGHKDAEGGTDGSDDGPSTSGRGLGMQARVQCADAQPTAVRRQGGQVSEGGGFGHDTRGPGEWVGLGASPPEAAEWGGLLRGEGQRRDPRDPRGSSVQNGPSPTPFMPPPLHIPPDPSIFPPVEAAAMPVLQRRDPRAALRQPSPLQHISPAHSPLLAPSPETPLAAPSPHYFMQAQVPAAGYPPAPAAAAPGEIAWCTRRLPDSEDDEEEDEQGEEAPVSKKQCRRVELRRDDPEVLGLIFSRRQGDALSL